MFSSMYSTGGALEATVPFAFSADWAIDRISFMMVACRLPRLRSSLLSRAPMGLRVRRSCNAQQIAD